MNYAVAANDPKRASGNIPADVIFWLLFAGCGVVCALVVLKPILGIGVVGTLVGCCVLVYLLAATLSGEVAPAILTWVLIFPLGYYFLSFPRDKSIITLDRVLPMLLLLTIALASSAAKEELPQGIRRCVVAGAAFLVVAGASCFWGGDLVGSGKVFVDSFFLPALLGWCVLRNFDVRRYATALHVVVSVMAIYTMAIGVAEDVLKEDLLPLPGSAIFFAGSIPRPNGPFYSFDSFAVIGVVTLFLLLFLRGTMGKRISLWQTWLNRLGILAALATALMPMFRAVAIGLMVALLLATWAAPKLRHKIAGFTFIGLCTAAVVLISVLVPETFEDRSRPENFYSRLAQQRQTFQVFFDHPFLGVGLGRFNETVKGESRYLASYQGAQAPNSPHNNLGEVATETGVPGLAFYVLTQIFLVKAFIDARKRGTTDCQLVWKAFLYLFLSYSINGLSAASGFNSDLNLWYVFAISIFYKYYMTEPIAEQPYEEYKATQLECSYVAL